MPQISRFFGIIISMYYDDHNPPHFHASYAEFSTKLAIDDLRILDGNLPSRALGLVIEWASNHKDDLKEDWERAKKKLELKNIEPLN